MKKIKVKYAGKKPYVKILGAGVFLKDKIVSITPEQYEKIKHVPGLKKIEPERAVKIGGKK